MMPLIIIIFLQIAIAAVVVLFLKNLLDRELEKAAIEKTMSLKTNAGGKTIYVYSARTLPAQVAQELTAVIKNKFTNGQIVFEKLKNIKGGLIIKFDDETLDFSLSSRLKKFWS